MQAQDALRHMQKWFELEIRNKGVTPTAKMLVFLVRAIVRALPDPKREVVIRRYAAIAQALGPEVQEEVLNSEEYDDFEYTVIGRATSELWEPTVQDTPEPKPEPELLESVPIAPRQPQEPLPEVRATDQKGGGLLRVKEAMAALDRQPKLPDASSEEERRDHTFERQRIMEETSVEIALGHWREADEELRKLGVHTALQTRPMGALMWQWYQALLPVLNKELVESKRVMSTSAKAHDDRYIYGPYLELMSTEKLAVTTILCIMSCICRGKSHQSRVYESEIKLGSLTMMLSKAIEEEYRAETSISTQRRSPQKPRGMRANARKSRSQSTNTRSQEADMLRREWPTDLRVKLGAMLLSKLIETAQLPVTRLHPRTKEKITRMQPAFLHGYKWDHGRRIGHITGNAALMEKLESEPLGGLIAKRMPMLVEPRPWHGWNKGGYLHYTVPIMRLPMGDNTGRDYFMAADNNGDLDRVYAGLNALSRVPWRVHADVLKVQIEAWNTGEEIANLAPLHTHLDTTLPPEPTADADPDARRKWVTQVREIESERMGKHSQRCYQNFQLEISRSVKDEVLYFPHNMDFRGRAYPIPPYLNHMGADNVRGLLVFADGKPLGLDGLRWLKIHLATAAGHDKASLDERVAFVMEHLDDIYDSVRDPLGGQRWWLKSEDAWQTLAACFELTAALNSPDPTQYVSHLPVQQDGTCNGLQHYAALGGDEIGARQVNLEPGDKPADVYTAVADAVKEEVRKDAEQGDAVAQKLHGRITRKCVKHPVMTNVYGVTFYGARAQVEKQLVGLFPEVATDDAINLRVMSNYITTKIYKSLGDMFRGAQAIQDWLGQCAHLISTSITPEQIAQASALDRTSPEAAETQRVKAKRNGRTAPARYGKPKTVGERPLFKSTVVWTTPLRLPVVQPYRQAAARKIETSMQGISIHEPQVWDPVSKRKQLQAFAPNFIHSLDATHMLLSAAKCTERGMTFASVHDSFWTHACDVDRMSDVLRDAFVEMHSENIILRLREEFLLRYKDCMHLATMAIEDPALRNQLITLRRSRRWSPLGRGELAEEVERLRLLRSDDPAERQKGEAMITPASIVAQAGEQAKTVISMPQRLNEGGLGELPDKLVDTSAIEEELTDAAVEEVADHDDEDVDVLTKAKSAQATKDAKHRISVWQPLTFPEMPARGTFDVTRLRDSKYFFH